MNRVRSLMRKLCGIAAIHHYYGEHEQILPVLKLGLNISKAAAAGPPTTINGLVCIAVDSVSFLITSIRIIPCRMIWNSRPII